MSVIACDISYFQPVVGDAYPRRWLIFRCCDGDFFDPNAPANLEWSLAAVASGRMDGFTLYVVYRPGLNAAVMAHLTSLTGWRTVMIDVESWQGQIRGDHSGEINQLGDLIIEAGGYPWIYGNQGDLAEIAPNRKPWPVVVASYTSTRPDVPNMIGWQYTNGVENYTGNPSSSEPFQACDHNELYVDVLSPQGGGTPIEPPAPIPEEAVQKDVIFKVGDGPDVGQTWIFFTNGRYLPIENDIETKVWLDPAFGAWIAPGDVNGASITGATHASLRKQAGA